MAVLQSTGIKADHEHVQDFKEISRYGVMGTLSLVINGKVFSQGLTLFRIKIKIVNRKST